MKRVLYIVSVLLVSVLLVCSMLIAALMSDKVETAAVQLVTAEFSRALGTRAQVGSVAYRFPARLALNDVYIEDQQSDTLAFVGEVYAHFSSLALRNNEIRFSHVRLSNVVAKIYRTDGVWNYQFLADAFRSDKAAQPLRSLISVRDIQLESIRLQYEDHTLLLSRAKMDLHQLSEEVLDAEIRELAMQITNDQSPVTNRPSPFIVEDMKAHVILNDTMLSAPTLRAQLPNSRLDLSGIKVQFPDVDTLYLSRSAHEITFALNFNEAQLVPSDIALFMPRLKGLKRPITMDGGLTGTLDSLAFHDIAVRYNGATLLKAMSAQSACRTSTTPTCGRT